MEKGEKWTFIDHGEYREITGADGSTLMRDTQYYPLCPSDYEVWELMAKAPELAESNKALAEALRELLDSLGSGDVSALDAAKLNAYCVLRDEKAEAALKQATGGE